MTQRGVLFVLGLLILAALISPAHAVAQTLSLDGETSVGRVGPGSAHLADPEGRLSAKEALERFNSGGFQPVSTSHFEAGYSTTPHWIATEIRNDAGAKATYRLLTNLPFAPAISITLVRNGDKLETLLEKHLDTPWLEDQFLSLAVATPAFTLAQGETALLLTRFHPYGLGILPLSIETKLTAAARSGDAAFVRALFYGFAITSVFMLTLYVLAIWRSSGVSLIVCLASGLLIMAQIDGVLNAWVWPLAPHWNKVASFPLLMLLCASMFWVARDTFLTNKRSALASVCQYLSLSCLGVLGMMIFIDAALLVLAGFAMLIIGLTMLSYGSISIVKRIQSRSTIALGVGVFVFVIVGMLMTGIVTGTGDIGAQNLLISKIQFAMMTMIFIISYAAQAAGLAQLEARFAKKELAQARAAASNSAALLEAERKYFQARDAEIRQTQRLENVSHDLRQPISTLKLTLKPLLEGDNGQGVQSAIDYLDRLVSAQLGGTEDDLNIATDPDALEAIQASLLVSASVEMFRKRAEEKGLKLRGRPCKGIIMGSPIQLMRILNNLVSNAVEHTETGGVLVASRCHREKTLIEVYDTGPGMSEDEIRLFQQRRQKGKTSHGGGFGLAICFELAEKNGFGLTVKSRAGRGTTFSLAAPKIT